MAQESGCQIGDIENQCFAMLFLPFKIGILPFIA